MQRYVHVVEDRDPKAQAVIEGYVDTYVGKGGNGRKRDRTDDGRGLAEIRSSENVHIFGHGTPSTISDLSAEGLAARLVELGLPRKYSGRINLTSCNAGRSPGGDLPSFAASLQAELERSERPVEVKALLGASFVDRYGRVRVKADPDKFNEFAIMIKS